MLQIVNELLKQPHRQRAAFTDLAPLLRGALNSIKRRSLIFIVSDFISQPGWERPLSLLNLRHETVAVCLRDPHEIELPDVGPVIMQDSETGEQLYVDTHDKILRQRFHQAALERERQLTAALHHAGVDPMLLSTDEDLVAAVIRFAALRERRRRLS